EIAVSESDASGVAGHHAGTRVEDGRLPDAVRPDEPGDGTGCGMERDAVDRDEPTELHRQAVHVQVGLHLDHGRDPWLDTRTGGGMASRVRLVTGLRPSRAVVRGPAKVRRRPGATATASA